MTRSLELGELSESAAIGVALAPATRCEVRVVDAASLAPVAGAHVHVLTPRVQPRVLHLSSSRSSTIRFDGVDLGAPAGKTDAHGIAALTEVGTGFHHVVVVAAGFRAGHARWVELPPEPAPLVVALEPGHDVEALVIGEDGTPLPAVVTTFTSAGDQTAFRGRTDESGRVRSGGYRDGDAVTVSVERPRLNDGAQFLEMLVGPLRQHTTVPATAPVRIVVPGRTCPVRAIWPTAAPTDLLHLRLFQKGRAGAMHALDRAEVGASVMERVLGGAGRGEYIVEALGTESGIWRSDPVFADCTGATTARLSERVLRSAALYLLVERADGSPAPGVMARLVAKARDLGRFVEPGLEERSEAIAADVTDRGGAVAFERLLPGRYVVDLRGEDAAAVVSIEVDGARAETVRLAAHGRLRGVVAVPPGEHVAVDAEHAQSSLRRSVFVDEQGAFGFDLPPGAYRVAARQASPGADGRWQEASNSSHLVVEVVAGQERYCELTLAQPTRRVRVQVVDHASAEPLEVLAERIHPYDVTGTTSWSLVVPAGRDGTAEFARLEVDAAYGFVVRRRADQRPLGWASIARGSSTSVTVALARGVRVSVVGADASTDLVLVPLHAEGFSLREGAVEPQARAGGAIDFESVVPGRYHLVRRGVGGRLQRTADAMQVDVGTSDLRIVWSPR